MSPVTSNALGFNMIATSSANACATTVHAPAGAPANDQAATEDAGGVDADFCMPRAAYIDAPPSSLTVSLTGCEMRTWKRIRALLHPAAVYPQPASPKHPLTMNLAGSSIFPFLSMRTAAAIASETPASSIESFPGVSADRWYWCIRLGMLPEAVDSWAEIARHPGAAATLSFTAHGLFLLMILVTFGLCSDHRKQLAIWLFSVPALVLFTASGADLLLMWRYGQRIKTSPVYSALNGVATLGTVVYTYSSALAPVPAVDGLQVRRAGSRWPLSSMWLRA